MYNTITNLIDKFNNESSAHIINAVLLCELCLNPSFNNIYPFFISILYLYFGFDLIACIYKKDLMFSIHAILALGLTTFFYFNPKPVLDSNFYYLVLIEAQVPLLHNWKYNKDYKSFLAFYIAFFVTRILFLPYITYKIVSKLDNVIFNFFVYPLNFLQFGWFYKLTQMLINYEERDKNQSLTKKYKINRRKYNNLSFIYVSFRSHTLLLYFKVIDNVSSR